MDPARILMPCGQGLKPNALGEVVPEELLLHDTAPYKSSLYRSLLKPRSWIQPGADLKYLPLGQL